MRKSKTKTNTYTNKNVLQKGDTVSCLQGGG